MSRAKKIILPTDKQPVLRVKTLPNDTNPYGGIFGGWLMAQIDMAGWIIASEKANGAVATVAVKELLFLQPIFTFDVVSFYADITHIGNTSITVHTEAYAQRSQKPTQIVKVASAVIVYVAVGKPGKKRKITK